MKTVEVTSDSDLVRQHASEVYLAAARRRREATISVNVGAVHKALGLSNRVPLVCAALGSKKFLTENGLRLISKTGPPSGLSTTVTYTYEFVEAASTPPSSPASQNAWAKLRGSLKDVYAELGGGEAYLRAERSAFRSERNPK
ncbi:MAG: hypothetical protein WB729_09175 [Candidatus Sulfotelmatobacter sp.]